MKVNPLLVYLLLFSLLPLNTEAQLRDQPDAASIKLKLKRLNFLGSVLYVAAHPDDENTRIITSMANERMAATAYLSMTRGDGGQNLIGPEMRDLLGLIRTQELLAARRIDGGEQFFTRANDFGYSKSADETLAIWGKDSILHDVVKVFRQFQPDVIITRFPPDERAGHGHHTASAMLAIEAFDKAAMRDVFPSQLTSLSPWQPKRLYTNTGRWWNTTINENTPGIVTVDVGGYSALLGESYSEIAARSRSQHKSQGFGSAGTRGRQLEFLEYGKGEKAEKDVFEGVNTTWTRVKGGELIQASVNAIIKSYNEENPAAIIPALLKLRNDLRRLENSVWKTRKLKEVEQLIEDCAGLYLSITADNYMGAIGESVSITLELLNRSSQDITIDRIVVPGVGLDTTTNLALRNHIPVLFTSEKRISKSAEYSDPYWLKYPHEVGLFTVKDRALIGKPENPPSVQAFFTLRIGKETMEVSRPLIYKRTDPVKGEVTRPFEIVPPVFVNLSEDVLLFRDLEPKQLSVLVKSASKGKLSGVLKPELPVGWRSEPVEISFSMDKAGAEQSFSFKIFPSQDESTTSLTVAAWLNGKRYDKSVHMITYDHIPVQTVLPAASSKLVRVNIKGTGGTIGYLKGAGDDVPAALRNMGFNVWEMKNEEVTAENLKRVDAVVLGIRAFNTNERIGYLMGVLFDYVKNGGTLVAQYNTSFDMETDRYSPYPLKISRDRVSQEDSEVRILKPDHHILNYPNKITSADFNNWVQERGLYFPGEWDPAFEAVLSMNDRNEKPKDGSVLVAKYGEGHYVYTGLSFFRQLPEGVAGAYKLFANLVSVGKKEPVVVPTIEAVAPETKKSRRKK